MHFPAQLSPFFQAFFLELKYDCYFLDTESRKWLKPVVTHVSWKNQSFLLCKIKVAYFRSFYLFNFLIFFLPPERPRKIFTVRLTMVDRNYTSAYKDLTNFNTRGLISDLTEIFTQFFRGIFTGFVSITFREFFPGSVGAIFDAAFAATSDVNETSIIQALARASGKSQLRFETLGVITIENGLSTPTTAPTGWSKFHNNGWRHGGHTLTTCCLVVWPLL